MKTPYYLKHPANLEEVEALRAKGYEVIDAKFAPKDWVDPEAPKPAPKRVRKSGGDL